MTNLVKWCCVLCGLTSFFACSTSPDALLRDGQRAMATLNNPTIDSAAVNRGISSLEKFLNRYPDDLRMDSALFMLASLQGVMRRNEAAARNFLKIVNNYRESAFRPKSIILAGHLFEESKDYENARACYQRLIREYPNHEFVVGGSAQWLLDHMGQPPEEWPIPFEADSGSATSKEARSVRPRT